VSSRPIPITSELPQRTRRHGRFWRVLLYASLVWVGVTAAYLLVVWPWMRGWGATKSDQNAVLRGDDIVPNANLRATKAITIQAPPEAIYPWLLQIGVDRGGMYSYAWLENLFGLKVNTVERIVPAYQETQPGDFWRFTPKDFVLNPGPGLYVHELVPNQAVLLTFGLESKPDDEPIGTWQFVLEPQANGATRLLLRSNMAIKPELPIKLTYFVQFIMERKMLLTLRDRAEGG
jgi:hypothetical protein